MFLFNFFSHFLIFTLVAGSISRFLTTAIKFTSFSSNEIVRLRSLSLALALSLLSTSMKERRGFVIVVVLVSQSPGGFAIYRRNAWVLEMRNFIPGLHEWVDVRTHDFLRAKITWMHR